MSMPFCLQASHSSVPFGTRISCPSTVIVTRSSKRTSGLVDPRAGHDRQESGSASRDGLDGSSVVGARAEANVLFVVVEEILHRGNDVRCRTISQGAERPAQDVVADIEEEGEILLPATSTLDSANCLRQPGSALPTGNTLSARLVGEELAETELDF